MTKVKAKQSGIIVKHANPDFHIEFKDDFIEVSDEVADFLKRTNPNAFEFEDEKRKKSSFKKLPDLKEEGE